MDIWVVLSGGVLDNEWDSGGLYFCGIWELFYIERMSNAGTSKTFQPLSRQLNSVRLYEKRTNNS